MLALLLAAGCHAPAPDGGPPLSSHWALAPVAATYTVCPDGSGDYESIQQGLDDVPSGAILSLCAGTYRENIVHYTTPVALVAADGPGSAIIDGGGSDRALRVRSVPAPGFAMSGVTIRNGYHDSYNGAGMFVKYSVLIVDDSRFEDNAAAGDGGGLWVRDSEVLVTDSLFQGNSAVYDGGGALFDDCRGELRGNRFEGNVADDGGGLFVEGDELLIVENEILDNDALDLGGGIYLDGDAPIEANTIRDNRADDDGGGLYAMQSHGPLTDNLFEGNTCGDDGGGAYMNNPRGDIIGNTFTGNFAGDDAGGLRVFVGYATVTDNDISYNEAADAGGGAKLSHAQSDFLRNTLVGNVTGDRGGGLELDNDTSLVQDCHFEANQAAIGGGLHSQLNHSEQTITASTFVDNQAEAGGGIMLETDTYLVTMSQLRMTGNQAERGGALHALDSRLLTSAVIMAENSASAEGGAVYTDGTTGHLFNITAWSNTAPEGAALFLRDNNLLRVGSNIITENSGGAAVETEGAAPFFYFNDVWNNASGAFAGMDDPTGNAGNLAADPLFTAPEAHDFHLSSGTPARNAGVPWQSDPDGTRADMGAYGGPYGSW